MINHFNIHNNPKLKIINLQHHNLRKSITKKLNIMILRIILNFLRNNTFKYRGSINTLFLLESDSCSIIYTLGTENLVESNLIVEMEDYNTSFIIEEAKINMVLNQMTNIIFWSINTSPSSSKDYQPGMTTFNDCGPRKRNRIYRPSRYTVSVGSASLQ